MRSGGESPLEPATGRAPLRDALYATAATAARTLLPVLGAARPALASDVAERRAAAAALAAWAGEKRDPRRRLLWLHAASAGELLGAVPILRALRDPAAAAGRESASGADLQLVVTHFSPSGRPAATALEPDWHGFPPLDAPGPCRHAVEAARPDALVFAKGDVWPGLVRAAAEHGVATGLVNATVREDSSRLRPPLRWLTAPAYARLRRVGAVSEEDAARLRRLGARPSALEVTGDAAFDQALRRVRGTREVRRRLEALLAPGPPRPRLVAGSTWPADEEVLLGAAARLAVEGRRLDLVLVPHEPTTAHVDRLRARTAGLLGREPALWSAAGSEPEPAWGGGRVRTLVVDALGVLAELYGGADLAYVGGGFGEDGLHSVIEPAAAGVPVLFGPRHDRWEAGALLERGAARVIVGGRPASGGRPAPEGGPASEGGPDAVAAALVGALLDRERERQRMGRAARAFVEEGSGAASAGARLVRELLGS